MKSKKEIVVLSDKIKRELKKYSKKIEISGSIRRKEENPGDIDIVLIPKDRLNLEKYMETIGKFVEGGIHESTWIVNGVKVELYYTNEEEWGAELLAYSGRKGSNIGLRIIAKRKGFKLSQHGLFKGKKRIAGKSEREIYGALKRPYKKPEER